MEIDILIDELTACLIQRETGLIVETDYEERQSPIKFKGYNGWKFDWTIPENNDYKIYELFVKGDDTVQGRIAFKIDGGVADVNIVEAAPHNVGHNGEYIGVGGHLFAIACQYSMDAGCDGYVAFTAKTNLIEHYKKKLGAEVISGQKMYIGELEAQKLIDKYLESR